ncbi:S66 peptidase family protein [Daejeonella lutea]|uniref:Muramoyltetrapeptide carboxypeptidase n=1 Tax=Daejeonella lutea TaxID=572036 RepID=A0A1T5DQR5_9SPHI|nr:LD-carboxypeptidase [Daejeonella lutea]SKB74034.1 muramoyltetrapeptide carboxypeptidase [Daejeonella lutea]
MITPPYLQKGDTVAITCPAKSLPVPIDDAVKLLESWGLKVVLGETVYASWHQFAGTDELRTADFQKFLDDDSVKAIFAARGGYGTIRIIDGIDFSRFEDNPKWIIGFSDITILHSHINAVLNTQSIHGQMPLTIPDGTKVSLETLRKALFNEPFDYSYTSAVENKSGSGSGMLIGGNLTLLLMMSGSVSEQDYKDKILFLEDVGEYFYSIDRMILSFKRAGILAELKGLIIGGFTDLKDNDIPFGHTAEEIIVSHVKEYDYPVCFNFPAGHIEDNRALIFGREVTLTVDGPSVSLTYSNQL